MGKLSAPKFFRVHICIENSIVNINGNTIIMIVLRSPSSSYGDILFERGNKLHRKFTRSRATRLRKRFWKAV